jgi:large repetitive protein
VDILGDNGTFSIRVSDTPPVNTYPVNDSICDAVNLGTVPSGGATALVSGNNFCATTEPGEPNVDACPTITSLTCDETVWYRFTTSANPGEITVAITNAVGINAILNVYRVSPAASCAFGDLTYVANADNLISNNVSLVLPCLVPNTTYYVQVDGVDVLGDNGTFQIRVTDNGSFVAAPANDLICGAVAMGNPTNSQVGPIVGTNDCATIETGEPNMTNGDETVWYSFIAPASGSAEVIINSISGIDVSFAIYHSTGPCNVNNLDQVGSTHNDLLSFSASYTEECLIPGALYYVQIDGVDILGDYGDFNITVRDDNPGFSGPPNDPCSGAITIPIGNEPCYGTGLWNVYNYGNPTTSLNNSFVQGCGDNCGDLWYTFTMPASGTVLIEGNDEYGFLGLANSQVAVAAYQGPCSNLAAIDCELGGLTADPTYFVSGTPGSQIYLQVFDDGGDDNNEPFGLCVTNRCGADDCNLATPMQEATWYCFDTDGAGGETQPTDPGYEECGDGSDPGHSVYFTHITRCPTFSITIQGNIGGLCILSEPTDGLSFALYLDNTPCDWAPQALLDCELTDACDGTTFYFNRVYSAPVGSTLMIQLDGFDFTGDNSGQIRIDEGCPLDIDYDYFSGYREEGMHELNWGVLDASALEGRFIVERSLTGDDFVAIGQVAGDDYVEAGGSQGQGGNNGYNYHLTDALPIPGHNYYRLRFFDQNGTESLSDVIDLYFDGNSGMQIVGLYPNPARDLVNLDTYVPQAGVYRVRIIDMYGSVVHQEDLDFDAGANHHRFGLEKLSSGMYMVQLSNRSGTQSVHKRLVRH